MSSGPPTVGSTAPASPAIVWKTLARFIAAPGRTQMRLYNTETEKFSDTGRLTEALPRRPAAVYFYTKGRTHELVLDFDAKNHGAAQVKADLDTAAHWITTCGGVFVTDASTNGGRHLICPLAIGTSASCDEMKQLVRLLAARLPTLDITPNTNPETGCISVPGSPDKYGGYRQLDGSVDNAIEAFTIRSAPDLLPRLYMLLGALNPSPNQHSPSQTTPEPVDAYLDGHGDDTRIAPAYRRLDALPADVEAFATYGALSPNRPTWESRHEARMSLIVNAIARGHSLADLRDRMAPGAPWHDGLGAAYARYNHRAEIALGKDFAKALDWYVTNVLKSSPPRHKKKKYSPGGLVQGWRGPKNLREWLANALAWADAEYAGKRCRWTVHAVLQGLAFQALVAGELRSGTWLVGVGGRTLSLATGLLSEDAVWRVLADLRERPGAPLILVRQHVGTEPDVYALTSQYRVTHDASGAERVRVEQVHDAWSVVGHRLRRIYELVAAHGLTRKADIYAAAALPRATGDAMILDLEIAGLLVRTGHGTVGTGPRTLDDIAEQHHLDATRQDRIHRHREERAAWRAWLAERDRLRVSGAEPEVDAGEAETGSAAVGDRNAADDAYAEAYQSSVMITGPPGLDDLGIELEAIEMISELLGGRILTR